MFAGDAGEHGTLFSPQQGTTVLRDRAGKEKPGPERPPLLTLCGHCCRLYCVFCKLQAFGFRNRLCSYKGSGAGIEGFPCLLGKKPVKRNYLQLYLFHIAMNFLKLNINIVKMLKYADNLLKIELEILSCRDRHYYTYIINPSQYFSKANTHTGILKIDSQ